MHFHHSQRSLQLTPNTLNQLQRLVQAHRTPQAIARRAQLIEVLHTHPDWNTKQTARTLNRHESWVRKRRRRWNETHSLKDASTFRCTTSVSFGGTSASDGAGV